ncbi:DUF6339 family protein [Planococcus lenghuensis]|uniref:Uncharacterized protein n=1 Tax=Planococcus lenghuensis TaxID=2213202 RepID=A0A1Q2L5B2_9BACL|nr:DUF6339 family protein [Planococcus lenghuensis]AQQ55606.1 hypothetical protein B0X71_20755 [Planococcus lenghuensis]
MSQFYLNQKKYLELQQQIEENTDLYYSDNSWLAEELGIKERNRANLIVSNESNPSLDDLENAIKLHKTYIDLPYSLASDGNFWSLLAHTEYWDYMRARWPVEKARKDQLMFIGRRYFFKEKGRARNGLARLWWFAELSYEGDSEDPYHFTRLMLQDQDLAGQIIENAHLSRNRFALKALFNLLNYISEQESAGRIKELTGEMRRKLIREAAQYLNLTGAVELWDILSIDEAGKKLEQWVDKYLDKLNMHVSQKV